MSKGFYIIVLAVIICMIFCMWLGAKLQQNYYEHKQDFSPECPKCKSTNITTVQGDNFCLNCKEYSYES